MTERCIGLVAKLRNYGKSMSGVSPQSSPANTLVSPGLQLLLEPEEVRMDRSSPGDGGRLREEERKARQHRPERKGKNIKLTNEARLNYEA